MSEKIKVQCQACHKFLGGTPEQLKAKPACPKCGAQGQWWRQVETRMIQRARMQAQQQNAAYVPPPPAHGQGDYVPLQMPKFTIAVFVLGIVSVVVFPCGWLIGPVGFFLGFPGRGQVKRGEVPSSGMHTAGWVLSMMGFGFSALLMIIGLAMGGFGSDRKRYFETHDRLDQVRLALIEYERKHKEYPSSLDGLGVPVEDGWGRRFEYVNSGWDFEVISLGADGIPGGASYNADISAYPHGVETDVSFLMDD